MVRSMKRGCKKTNHCKFNKNNIKNKWKRSKRQRKIQHSEVVNKAWEQKKSVKENMRQMGLVYDLNDVPQQTSSSSATEKMNVDTKPKDKTVKNNPKQSRVIQELAEEANQPLPKTLRLSQPDIRYCIYMMEKYGEDYDAMTKDPKNVYQDTAAQIKRKIQLFKSIPVQYNAYLRSKGLLADNGIEAMDTH